MSRNKPRIVFCNVGQGDGIYIRTPSGSDMIIDTGPNQRMADCLARHMPFFDTDIEVGIITHHDHDHDGGLPVVQQRYHLKKILDNTSLTTGDRMVTKDLTVTVLYPDRLVKTNTSNNNGVILLLQSKQTNALFLADVDVSFSEPALTAHGPLPTIHILKVSHHGSQYGTSTSLLQYLMPTRAVISAGSTNRYGHPHPDILKKLTQLGITVIEISKTGDYEYIL
ncbi:MAG: MBL fold metallo-hydrolase [Candidatus Roizmanbacteria bacterium]|nr:MBL fold metallo-hydrolase [Candidatus Roizmanbacteria bacterium]